MAIKRHKLCRGRDRRRRLVHKPNGNKVLKLPDSAQSEDDKKIKVYNGAEYNYNSEAIKSK